MKTDTRTLTSGLASCLLILLCAGCGSIDEDQSDPRPILYIEPDFVKITGGNVTHGEKGVDAELLNATGITITFDENIKTGTAVLRPQGGAPLNWIVQWGRCLVTLYRREPDRLQKGTAYVLILELQDPTGTSYAFKIEFSTKK